MQIFFLFLLLTLLLALTGLVAAGLYLLGWRFPRILLPLLLLLVVLPFRNYAYELGFAIEFETDLSRMSAPTAAFIEAYTWSLRIFYAASLVLTWRFPSLAPAAPTLLLLLLSWLPFGMLGGIVGLGNLWRDQNLVFRLLLLSLLLLSYTLPSLLRRLARRAWLPEPLSQSVLKKRLTYREKVGVLRRLLGTR